MGPDSRFRSFDLSFGKPLILDPFGTIFDVFGHDWNFDRGFDKPCGGGSSLPQALFSMKMATPGFDKPCCCYPACRRRFFFGEDDHPRKRWCCCGGEGPAGGSSWAEKLVLLLGGVDSPQPNSWCCC